LKRVTQRPRRTETLQSQWIDWTVDFPFPTEIANGGEGRVISTNPCHKSRTKLNRDEPLDVVSEAQKQTESS